MFLTKIYLFFKSLLIGILFSKLNVAQKIIDK